MKSKLPDGRYFQYDLKDAELVAAHRWHVVNGYVQTEKGSRHNGDRTTLRLHRLIMQPAAGQIVDHINRDPFDNRRANLRIATKSTNGMNRPAQANNTSGYKGVARHSKTGKWRAYITAGGKTRHLGLFQTPEQAHEAYVQAAGELHGEFACA